jgi:hypothetical protein
MEAIATGPLIRGTSSVARSAAELDHYGALAKILREHLTRGALPDYVDEAIPFERVCRQA